MHSSFIGDSDIDSTIRTHHAAFFHCYSQMHLARKRDGCFLSEMGVGVGALARMIVVM